MKISVTETDIAKGDPGDSLSCPIALALKRKVGIVRVGYWAVDLECKSEMYRGVQLPLEAVEFIKRFDFGKSVEPFTFDLPIK